MAELDEVKAKVDALQRAIHTGDKPISARLLVVEDKLNSNDKRVNDLEKMLAYTKAEENKAKMRLYVSILISLIGWLFAIITKISGLDSLKKILSN